MTRLLRFLTRLFYPQPKIGTIAHMVKLTNIAVRFVDQTDRELLAYSIARLLTSVNPFVDDVEANEIILEFLESHALTVATTDYLAQNLKIAIDNPSQEKIH